MEFNNSSKDTSEPIIRKESVISTAHEVINFSYKKTETFDIEKKPSKMIKPRD